jgi:hypothetical protein
VSEKDLRLKMILERVNQPVLELAKDQPTFFYLVRNLVDLVMPCKPILGNRGNPVSAFMVLQELIKGPEEGEVEELTEFDKYLYLADLLEGYLRSPPYADWNPVEGTVSSERTEAMF